MVRTEIFFGKEAGVETEEKGERLVELARASLRDHLGSAERGDAGEAARAPRRPAARGRGAPPPMVEVLAAEGEVL